MVITKYTLVLRAESAKGDRHELIGVPGRETFRRMKKWLQEPEFQRMASLRMAACKRKEIGEHKRTTQVNKKPRLVFTDRQRRMLHTIFKVRKLTSNLFQIICY